MTFKLPLIPYEFTYKQSFVVLALIVGLLMPYLSLDYGIIEDARCHKEHGERLLEYFKGDDNLAAQSPLNNDGTYIYVNKSLEHEHRGMNGFGGFFDLISSFLHQFFDVLGIYEFRNLLSSLFGFLLFLFCGLIAKEIGGWKLGVVAFVFVVLTPVLFGHSMYNPKDIPFAAFYIFSTFHILKLLKELPEVTLKRAFFLILNISISINIRLVGLVVIGHVFFAVFLWWFITNYQEKFEKIVLKDTFFLVAKVFAVCILGYLATSLFWPYVQSNILTGPVELFIAGKNFNGFEATQLFGGVWKSSFNMPWYYMISVLFLLTLPLHSLLGMVLVPVLYSKKVNFNKVLVSFLLFASFFPLVLIVLGRPNSYDNGRQFLFVIPTMLIVGALAWYALMQVLIKNGVYRKLIWGLFLVLLLEPFGFLLKNHPLHSLYYSPLIGGVRGAYENYEIDYWGVGIKPAIDWLADNTIEKSPPAKVRMYYGDQIKLSYFTKKKSNLQYVAAPQNSGNWDYSIVMLTEAKLRRELVGNWPPENTVHEVKVGGVTVSAVVKNTLDSRDQITVLEEQLLKMPTSSGYIQLSLLYYNKKNYLKSISASKKAISIDQKNSIAYNNLCSAYNMLLMYEKAKEACEKSLEFKQSNLAANNLNEANKGISRVEKEGLTKGQYLSLSYNYYQLQEYEYSVRTSKSLLSIDPHNYLAYNNICASNNVLKNYIKAAKACRKALDIKPDFELAKNNLKISESAISE